MPPRLLRTVDIKEDGLQMFENPNYHRERIVINKLMAQGPRKSKYNITFSTANQNINSVKELTTEGTLYKSLEAYHTISGSQAAFSYKVLTNKQAETDM